MIEFFILASGYGKRARPLSLIKPKPLFPLNGVPLIKIMLKQLKEKGLKKGFINLHHKSGLMRESLNAISGIKYFHEKKLSGNQVLKRALEYIDKYLLVINGDVFLEIPFEMMFKKITQTAADGILLVREDKNYSYSSIISEGDTFKKRIKVKSGSALMYTGVAIFNRRAIEKIDELSFFDSFTGKGIEIKTMIYRGMWLDIGDPELYLRSNFLYKRHVKDLTSNSLSENVKILPGSVVKDSIVWENTTIKDNSQIRNSIITGNITLSDVKYSNRIITAGKTYKL